jgi:hypothetical protein
VSSKFQGSRYGGTVVPPCATAVRPFTGRGLGPDKFRSKVGDRFYLITCTLRAPCPGKGRSAAQERARRPPVALNELKVSNKVAPPACIHAAGAQVARAKDQMAQLYRHFDGDGRLLYVGISMSACPRSAGSRLTRFTAGWFPRIRTITITPYPNWAGPAAAEIAAVRDEHPLFNQQHAEEPVTAAPPRNL